MIWLAVPRISTPVTPLFPSNVTSPVLLPIAAKLPTIPDKLIVGLPATPFPLVTATPKPEDWISRGVTVPVAVLAINPVVVSFRLLAAPVRPIVRGLRAPPSVKLKSPLTAKARLLGSDGS